MRRSPVFRSTRRPAAILALVLLAGSACRTAGPSRPMAQGAAPPPPLPRLDAATHQQPVTGRLEAGGTQDYLLQVPAHHYVRIEIEQRGVDLTATVTDPEGREIAWADGPGGNWVAESTSWISRTGGENRIHLESAEGETNGGEFRIEVAEMRPAVPTDRERLAADAALAEARGWAEGSEESAIREASELLDCARPIYAALGDHHRLAEIEDVAVVLAPRGDDVQVSQTAVALWEASEDLPRLLDARITQADLQYRADERVQGLALQTAQERAFAELESVLWLARSMNYYEVEAYALSRLGYLHHRLEQIPQALEPLQQAAEIQRDLGNAPGEFAARQGLGAVQAALGQPYRALESFERATELGDEYNLTDRRQTAALLLNHGYLLSRLGQLDAAQEKLLAALELNRQLGDRSGEYRLHLHLGSLYSRLGESRRAESELQTALGLVSGGLHLGYYKAYALFFLGWHRIVEGNVDDALPFLRQALAIVERPEVQGATAQSLSGNISLGLAAAFQKHGELESAVEQLRLGITAFQAAGARTGEVNAELKLGVVKRQQGKLDEAREILNHALVGAEQLEDGVLEGGARSELAALERAAGELRAALSQIERAIELRESLRSSLAVPGQRETFFAQWRQDYELMIDIMLRLQADSSGDAWWRRAFEASEKAHARTLLELLLTDRIAFSAGVPPELKRQEQQIEGRLSFLQSSLSEVMGRQPSDADTARALRARLAETRARRDELEREIWRTAPRYAAIRDPRVPSVSGLQAALPESTALLEYALGDAHSVLFVLSRDDFEAHSLPPAEEIAPLVERVRRALAGPTPDPRAQARLDSDLSSLYSTLIAPAHNVLSGVDRIVIVPDRALFYLPFEALRATASAGAPWSDGEEPYLLTRWSVGYAPSASVLLQLEPNDRLAHHRLDLVAFADPRPITSSGTPTKRGTLSEAAGHTRAVSQDLGELPGARQEVRRLAQLFDASKTEIRIGAGATEVALKRGDLSNARFLHFATHAVIDVDQPSYSYVALAADEDAGEDGLLHMFEVFDLHLATDLVVLSACETALGKELRGEGLIGLTRSFLYAGAPQVIVSLWPVSDESTPDLMVDFYSLRISGFDTLDALRQAKLALLQGGTYRHPRYWASFISVGAL